MLELEPFRELAILRGHTGPVTRVAWSPDGVPASASADRTVRVWDLPRARERFALVGHSAAVADLAYSADGAELFSVSHPPPGRPGELLRWDARSPPRGRPIGAADREFAALGFSPDGRRIASACGNGEVQVWDVAGGLSVVDAAASHPGKAFAVKAAAAAFLDPDGGRVVSAGADRLVRIWDSATGEPVGPETAVETAVTCLAADPGGRAYAYAVAGTGTTGGGVRVVSAADGAVRTLATAAGADVRALAFSRDGTRLAGGAADGSVTLWAIDDGLSVVRRFPATGGPVRCVAVSPDGRTVAAAHADPQRGDAAIRLLDADTGGERHALEGHVGAVAALDFGPDGRRLASTGADGTVRLWDPQLRREVLALTGLDGPGRTVAFSPDGDRIAAAGDGRVLRIWEAPAVRARP